MWVVAVYVRPSKNYLFELRFHFILYMHILIFMKVPVVVLASILLWLLFKKPSYMPALWFTDLYIGFRDVPQQLLPDSIWYNYAFDLEHALYLVLNTYILWVNTTNDSTLKIPWSYKNVLSTVSSLCGGYAVMPGMLIIWLLAQVVSGVAPMYLMTTEALKFKH